MTNKLTELEERLYAVERLISSVAVNIAVMVDREHGVYEIPEEAFIASVKGDVGLAKNILDSLSIPESEEVIG